jgi:hypothetical protein
MLIIQPLLCSADVLHRPLSLRDWFSDIGVDLDGLSLMKLLLIHSLVISRRCLNCRACIASNEMKHAFLMHPKALSRNSY